MLLVRKTANNKLNPFSLPCIIIVRFIWTHLLICHHMSYSQMAKSTRFIIKLLDQTKRQRVIIESLLGFEAKLGKQFSFSLIFASRLPKFIITRKIFQIDLRQRASSFSSTASSTFLSRKSSRPSWQLRRWKNLWSRVILQRAVTQLFIKELSQSTMAQARNQENQGLQKVPKSKPLLRCYL